MIIKNATKLLKIKLMLLTKLKRLLKVNIIGLLFSNNLIKSPCLKQHMCWSLQCQLNINISIKQSTLHVIAGIISAINQWDEFGTQAELLTFLEMGEIFVQVFIVVYKGGFWHHCTKTWTNHAQQVLCKTCVGRF